MKISVTVESVLLVGSIDTTSEDVADVVAVGEVTVEDVTVLLDESSVGNRVGSVTDKETEIEINGVEVG